MQPKITITFIKLNSLCLLFLFPWGQLPAQSWTASTISMPNQHYWPQKLIYHPDGDLLVLGQENAYDSTRIGIPIFGTQLLSSVVTKINIAGDSVWQRKFAANPLLFYGVPRARFIHAYSNGEWFLPYESDVGIQFCDTTFMVGREVEFPGMLGGSSSGAILSDSLHALPFCENSKIFGLLPRPQNNGLRLFSQDESLKIMEINSLNEVVSIKENDYQADFSQVLTHQNELFFIGENGDSLIWLATNLDGDSLYQRTISLAVEYAHPLQFIPHSNGEFLLLVSFLKPPDYQFFGSAILRMDANGTILQTHLFEEWNIKKIASLPNNEILVLRRLSYPQSDSQYIRLDKLDPDGQVKATSKYGLSGESPIDLTVADDGRFSILGLAFYGWGAGNPPAKGLIIQDHLANLGSVSSENELLEYDGIFYNSVIGEIKINSNANRKSLFCEVFDGMGKKVLGSKISQSKAINVDFLPKGLYIARISDGRSSRGVLKFIR